MNIVLFGPYGSGKGTQGKILAETYNLQVFDTGEQLRQHIKNQTELGLKIKEIVDRGDLVPNNVVMEVISSFIDNSDPSKGYLFDGIPRFQEQALSFDELLEDKEVSVKRIFVNIPRELSISRQVGRKTCQACGAIHQGNYEGYECSNCGTTMERRVENDESIAIKRAEVYETETLPMIQSYLDKNILFEVAGTGSIDEINKQIKDALKLLLK